MKGVINFALNTRVSQFDGGIAKPNTIVVEEISENER